MSKLRHKPGPLRDVRFSYPVNGVLNEVVWIHDGKGYVAGREYATVYSVRVVTRFGTAFFRTSYQANKSNSLDYLTRALTEGEKNEI